MFLHLEQILISYAGHMHLAIFAPLVSFIEELIPPIPSPSVMIATGAMAQVQEYLIFGLIFLAILGSLGKTLGASVVYCVAIKVEDFFNGKITKFIGITQEQITAFGARLSRSWRDYVILTILRALPIVPSSLLSVGCGLLKINYKVFVISTLIGSAIRDFIYIYLGYVGTKVAISFFKNTTNTAESIVEIVAVVIIILIFGYLYFRRKKVKS
jgi:membrane protein DedA with SNARE-associated domain